MKDEIMAQLNQYVQTQIQSCCNALGFPSAIEASVIGRPDSTHFKAEEARRALDFFDTSWNALYAVAQELDTTEQNDLKPFEEYISMCLTFDEDSTAS
jgi:hypothetical protein